MLEFIFLLLWIAWIFIPIIFLIRANSKIFSSIGILLLFTCPLVLACPIGIIGVVFGPYIIPYNLFFVSLLAPLIACPSLAIGITIGVISWRKVRKSMTHRRAVSIGIGLGALASWGASEFLNTAMMNSAAKRQFHSQYCIAFKTAAIGAVLGATPGATFDPPPTWHAKLVTPEGYYHWSFRENKWLSHGEDNMWGTQSNAMQKYQTCISGKRE